MSLVDEFQELADEFMDEDFVEFAKPMTFKLANESVIGSDPIFTTEVGTGIPVELTTVQFQAMNIKIGDKLIFTNASQWTITPEVDNVEIVFDGIAMSIIDVISDAADAAFFISAKEK